MSHHAIHCARSRLLASALVVLGLPAIAAPADSLHAAAAMPATVRYDLRDDIFHPVYSIHGMVATEQRLATGVGVEVLRQGGNAIDAAVAIAFALAVVLPNAGNIGGGGFMLIHDSKDGRDTAIDFRETAPGRASRDMYLGPDGQVIAGKSLFTHHAVGVPGTVAGMAYALSKYGSKRWADLIAPAIILARKGFPVSEELALMLSADADHLGQWPATRAIFFKDGRPLRAGERLIQRDLAVTLETLARLGPKAFYDGPIARKIVAEMDRHGGDLTLSDLRAYQVKEREPVVGQYRGLRIVSMPPPSSGGTHIIEILQVLEHFPLADYGADSAKAMHVMIEAMKLAYADRSIYLGDPDFVNVPVKGLTAPAYAAALAARIDPDRATPSSAIRPGDPAPYESDQTTHYSIADREGNVVATTYTLNLLFGSGIVAQGTGMLLNNEMDDFAAKPGTANAFGLTGGTANAITPMKRPLSSMSPTFVMKNGKPWIVTGSPGGSRIITTTLETIVDMVDFGMNPAEAAATPRFHHQWLPDEVRIEKGISADTVRLLEQMGHTIAVGAAMGRTQTIEIEPGGFFGYSDPRDPDGTSEGY